MKLPRPAENFSQWAADHYGAELHRYLKRRLRDDRDLARAIAPEAFDGADEAFGRLSEEMLSRFVRIQILRELATELVAHGGLYARMFLAQAEPYR